MADCGEAIVIFDWGFALACLPPLLTGLRMTIVLTLLGTALALALGLLWAILRRSRHSAIGKPVTWWVEFLRSTPLLVQLYFLFYVLPTLGWSLSPVATAVLTLGLHYSAYLSEVFRAGIDGVPRGQWEAALALDFSRRQTWTRIILPQAIPPVLPALGNYVIAMFKDTPVLAAITVVEVLQQAKIIGAESFRYLEPLTLVGALFLLLSLVSARLVRRLEVWSDQYR